MKKFPFFFIFLSSTLQYSNSQVINTYKNQKISSADSIRVEYYLNQANSSSLSSIKRQYFLDSVLVILPWWAEGWQQKAMPLFKQKKYEIGMIFLDSAVKYDDHTHHFLSYRAFIKCIFQRSYKSSLIDFDSLKKINTNGYVMDHPYDFYIGLCYLQLNKFDSAQFVLRKCIEEENKLNVNNVNYLHWFYLGIIYYQQEEYLKALEFFDKTLKIYSNFSDAKYYKSICLESIRRYNEAYQIALESKNDFENGYTFNEGNSAYEAYPYQINHYSFEGFLEYLKEKIK
jgi:tetratricopeptide (TPR) repeat protein